MANQKYCIANWKMNMTVEGALSFISEFQKYPLDNNCRLVICTDSVCLSKVADRINNTSFGVGAQNLYFEKKGAFTGEISAEMLINAGATYVIIGHSERRHIFNETDITVNKKLITALSAGLIPIFCIGEKLEDRERNLTKTVLQSQLIQGLKNVGPNVFNKIIIAYEPVWAIGTGLNADSSQVEDAHSIIRSVLIDEGFDGSTSSILYGGSVNTGNAAELLTVKGVDGFLIGGASLKVLDFFTIYQKFNKEIN